MANNNIDIMGLLTTKPSRGIDPRANMTPQQMRNDAFYSGMERMGRGVRGMLGGDRRTPEEQRKAGLADLLGNFDTMQPAQQKQIIAQLQASGQTALAGQLVASAQAKATNVAADRRREGLITQATGLGLNTTAELLRTGGSMDEAAKQIRSQEEKQLVAKQGRKGKVALARSRDAGDTMIKSIATGEYDSLSNEDFLKVINGQKAELKVYQGTDGVAEPFRVNESGKVYDAKKEKWVFPAELGLTQAANLTKTVTDADKLSSTLKTKASEDFLELNKAGRDAVDVLEINRQSQSLVDEGIITGFGSEFLLGMGRLGKQLGVVPQSVSDSVIATETFMAVRGRQVLNILSTGAVGSGTGISDKDIEFLNKIAASSIALDEASIMRLLRLEETAARNAISASNNQLELLKDFTGEGENTSLIDSLFIPLPEVTTNVLPTPIANKYLEQVRANR